MLVSVSKPYEFVNINGYDETKKVWGDIAEGPQLLSPICILVRKTEYPLCLINYH